MPVEPGRPEGQDPAREPEPRDGPLARWRKALRVPGVDPHDENDEPEEAPSADAVARTSDPEIEPETGRKQDGLQRHRRRRRAPQPETDPRPARPERQVRPVRYEVEDPVGHDADRDPDRARPVSRRRPVGAGGKQGPADRRGEAVRDRVVDEVERRESRVTRRDADALPTREQEDGPEKVQQDRGADEQTERRPRRRPLRREADRVMPDERSRPPLSPSSPPSRGPLRWCRP